MSDHTHDPRRFLARFSLDSWAVAIASALVVLIVLGVLPHISW
ncbi:MAG: hypothetical protein WA743_06820 [Pseudolabrys sp.]